MYSVKGVVFGQKWLYSGNVVAFGMGGCIGEKLLYSDNVVVFGQMWFYLGKSGSIWSKEILLRQTGCFKAKLVVFAQK